MKINTSICCIILSVLTSYGAEFDLGKHGKLSVTVPDDWSVNGKAVDRPDGTPIGYAFAIKPRSDANAKCLITLAYLTNGIPNREIIRKEVLRVCEDFVEQSVEKKKNLKEFSLEKGYGYYCLFTDASLVGKKVTPGDYKVMGSGEVQPGDNMLGVVSLFTDDADGKEFKAMVNIINSLKVTSKDAIASGAPSKDQILQVSEGKDEFTLVLPVSNLTMSIPNKGLSEGRNTQGGSADNPRYFFFKDQKEGIIVSGWFESQGRFSSAKKIWEDDTKEWSQQGLPAPTNVSFQKIEGWDAVVYDLPMPSGNNTHIRAQWVQAGTWIDLHLSVTSQRPIGECREKMAALLKSVQVKEKK